MLERGRVGEARESGAAPIEHDEPRERRKPREEAGVRGLLPGVLHVGDPARHEDEVGPGVAHHLVRDVDVALFAYLVSARTN